MIDLFRSMPAAPFALALTVLASPAAAQVSASDLIVRIERLETQIRQLTGALEQLQYHNQQLEQQVRRLQDDPELRSQDAGGRGARPAPPAVRPVGPAQPVVPAAPVPPRRSDVFDPAQSPPQRRSDVFDPTHNPNAPGVPHALGTMAAAPPADDPLAEPPGLGAPGGRPAGAPLDLTALGGQGAIDPIVTGPGGPPVATGPLPPPPPRNPNATGAPVAVLAPSATPRDEFDLGYGYVLRKDYALADQTFRAFLKKYPNDRLVPDANYWLGETLFQRQRYRDAAELFLNVSRDHGTTAKAPDALLRLGQSLAQLGEKDAACGTLAEVGRKYPRASLGVKQGVEREQKRVRC